MPISANLLQRLRQAPGAEAADDFVAWMDHMDTNRGDVDELRHELRSGLARLDGRFEKFEARFLAFEAKFDVLRAALGENLERGLREQTRFFFLAWSVLLAAIVGLYAR